MVTANLLTTSNNPHIAALEKVLDGAASPIEWLVIAHNDKRMLRSLADALESESAALLELPQDSWDLAGQELADMIEWALERTEIKNLVLVGHSQAEGFGSGGWLLSSRREDEAGPTDIYARLVAGVQRAAAHHRSAQAQFVAKFQQISQIPVVNSRLSQGELAVHGLFYRAESGVFVVYDPDTESFRPLIS